MSPVVWGGVDVELGVRFGERHIGDVIGSIYGIALKLVHYGTLNIMLLQHYPQISLVFPELHGGRKVFLNYA